MGFLLFLFIVGGGGGVLALMSDMPGGNAVGAMLLGVVAIPVIAYLWSDA